MTPTSDESDNPTASPEVETGPLTAARFPNVKKSELRVADATATFIVPVAEITEVMSYLRNEGGFTLLEDVTAVDWKTEPRYQVVYNMICLERQEVLRVKVNLSGDNPVIPTVTDIWPGANWYEREVFDLFGITFLGHPDLRRIEMPDDWEGHPLRKDYPIAGPRRSSLPANQFRVIGRSTQPEKLD